MFLGLLKMWKTCWWHSAYYIRFTIVVQLPF